MRLKLLLRDKTALICYIAAAAVILTVAAGLNMHANERSSLPIGLVLEDNREPALKLKNAVKECESLFVYDGDEAMMRRLLEDGYINCYFVVQSDYSEKVTLGDTDGVIRVCSPEDDNISIIAADIIAGYMMDEVCTDKAYVRYASLKRDKGASTKNFDEYKEYVKEMAEDEMFAFNFDIVYSDNSEDTIDARDITNGMIYKQIIAGMIAMLIMLAAFCAFNGVASDKERSIAARKKAMGISRIKTAFAEILAVFVYLVPLAILSALVFFSETEMLQKLLILNLILTMMCAILSYLCTLPARNVASYQMIGTIAVMILGVTGFISVFEKVMGISIFEYSPIALYISEFIKIV